MLRPMLTGMAPLARLQDEMNRLMEDFFSDMPEVRPYGQMYPAVNLWQDQDAAWLEAELPGLTMNDIEVLVTGNEVTLNGKREIPEQKDAAYHRRERASGQFSRVLTLPWEIDADKVEAKFHEGILTLKLPKCESCKPRKVKVLPA